MGKTLWISKKLDVQDYPCNLARMAGSKAALRMADRLTGGTLAERIGKYRKVDAPWRAIAAQLHDEFGVEVSPDTLRAWALELGVADGPLPETAA